MRRSTVWGAVCGLLILLPSPLAAQNPPHEGWIISAPSSAVPARTITGIVTRADNGEPLHPAYVMVGDYHTTIVTDSLGAFDYTVESDSSVWIASSALGFATATGAVQLPPDRGAMVHIGLTPAPPERRGPGWISAVPSPDLPPRTIAGVVSRIDDGKPLDLVQVFLRGTRSGTLTDTLGRFRLTAPSDGQFTIMSKRLGFESVARDVEVGADRGLLVHIALATSEIEIISHVEPPGPYAGEERRDRIHTHIHSGRAGLPSVLQRHIPFATAFVISPRVSEQ